MGYKLNLNTFREHPNALKELGLPLKVEAQDVIIYFQNNLQKKKKT